MMESIGEQLKSARNAQHLTLEQAARGTHISKYHLEALENEQFDVIPGETYRLGFLRSYANFLKLPPDALINRYKNLLIQEQQPPMQELLVSKPLSNVPVLRIVLIILGVVVLIGGGYLLYASGIFQRIAENRARTVEANRAARDAANRYNLEDAFLERRFSEGDVIVIPVDDTRVSLRITRIDSRMHIESDAGTTSVVLSENELIDVDGNGSGDIRVLVRSIERTANPPTAVARFDRVVASPDAPAFAIPDVEADGALAVGSTNIPARLRAPRTIATPNAGSLLQVEVDARVRTMVHYQSDSTPRVERFLQEGDTIRVDVSQRLLVWIANAGGTTVRIGGQEVGVGEAGQARAFMLSRENDGRSVQLVPLY